MKYYRINNRINVPQVRLVDDQGKYLGVFKIEEALNLAQEKGLDLIEISPKENPPVTKIIDFGKFLYEQKKKDKETKKKKQEIKSLRISFRMGKHDIDIRKKQIIKFIADGQKVKIEMMLRGREMAHLELAKKIFNDLVINLGDGIKIEQPLTKQGKKINILLSK
ncbi:MAG: translation initiation factor IF-3 [Bacteroidetes bacterium]|nr:translation initiation factor IF-3 [Bacteroidota bacterium]